MEPQLYRCGNADGRQQSRYHYDSFNGAATLSLRKYDPVELVVSGSLASMEPQLYRCGNLNRGADRIRGDHASMEPQLYRCGNMACRECRRMIPPASMEPQLYRCGNGDHWRREMHYRLASMEPQLYRCGNVSPSTAISCRTSLQWSRNFIVAEIMAPGAGAVFVLASLQWSRNFIVAEMWEKAIRQQIVLHASMEPQLYRCGNLDIRYWMAFLEVASMEPQLYRCGNLLGYAWQIYIKHASMEPQLYRCGNTKRPRTHSRSAPCFNGAATLSLRKSLPDIGERAGAAVLQWSRNFIVAEIYSPNWAAPAMKPLQWSRNFIVAEMALWGL